MVQTENRLDKRGPGWSTFMIVVVSLTTLLLMALFVILFLLNSKPAVAPIEIVPPPPPPTLLPTLTPAPLLVHVAGAVSRPGVVELPPSARVRDAIDAAGGFSSDANQDLVNLADELADGQYVRVPAVDEDVQPMPASKPAAPALSTDKNIDINTATIEELIQLPGVGETTAAKIVAHREQFGPFQAAEQIMDVPGIGEGKYDGFREMITVGP